MSDSGEDAARPVPAPQATAPQLDRFLDLQTQELNLRAREMDLRLQELNNAHNFSEQALSAQLQDREAERRHQRGEQHSWYVFVGLLVLVLLTAMLTSLYLDKEEFARELLKALLYVAPAGAGGYFYGRNREKKKQEGDEDE